MNLKTMFFVMVSFLFVSNMTAQYGAVLPTDETLEITNAIIELDFPQQGTTGQVGQYRFVESYLNDYSSYPNAYLADSIAIGDEIWDSKGDRFVVVKINNPGSNPLDFEVNPLNANGIPPNAGTAVIYKPTGNFGLTLQTTNLAEKLKILIFNHNMIKIDYWLQNAIPDPQVLTQSGTDVTLSGGGGTINLGDIDPTNEFQSLSIAGNTISISDGNSIQLPTSDGTDTQITGTGIASVTGEGSVANPYNIDVPVYVDPDNDPTNEYQDLAVSQTGDTYTIIIDNGTDAVLDLSGLNNSGTDDQTLALAGNTLGIEDGNSVDLSGYLDNTDNQDLTLAGNSLTLTGDGTPVDLSGYLDNTDEQTLGLSGNTLSITNGNSVDLSGYVSSDDQTLTLASNQLTIEDGNTVSLSPYLDNTDEQDLNISGNTLSITGGNSVDLSNYLDNTDEQDLSLTGTSLVLTGDGTPVDLSSFLDNTDEQTLGLSGNTLSITNGNSVDLSGYVSSDDQALTVTNVGSVYTVAVEDGGQGTINVNDGDFDPQNELQDLTGGIVGDVLTIGITDGTDATVNLSSYLDNTDDQTLALSGNTLSIEAGNSVDLAAYLDNTDNQTLTFSNNSLSISGGNAVDLSGYMDNTDDQQIQTFAYNDVTGVLTLAVEDAGAAQTVNLSSLKNFSFRVDTDVTNGDPEFYVDESEPAIAYVGTNGVTTTHGTGNEVIFGLDGSQTWNWRDTVITFTNGGTGFVNVLASGDDFTGLNVTWVGNTVTVVNTGEARLKKVTAQGMPSDLAGTGDVKVRVQDANGDINQSFNGTMFPGNTTCWTKAIIGGGEAWQNRQDNPPSSQMEFRVPSAGVGEYTFKDLDSYGGGFIVSVVGA